VSAVLPEGWEIDDRCALHYGEVRAMLNALGDVVFVADMSRLPRVPAAVVRALLARAP
jgi:predicted ABC-class ATPase